MKLVKATEIQVGNVIHAYGARFEVISINIYTDRETSRSVHANIGKWLDGRIETGYFGPDRTFNFQGNDLKHFQIEG